MHPENPFKRKHLVVPEQPNTMATISDIDREKEKYTGKYVAGYSGPILNILRWGNDEVKIIFGGGDQPLFPIDDPKPIRVFDEPPD